MAKGVIEGVIGAKFSKLFKTVKNMSKKRKIPKAAKHRDFSLFGAD